jgi:hypothetical protein
VNEGDRAVLLEAIDISAGDPRDALAWLAMRRDALSPDFLIGYALGTAQAALVSGRAGIDEMVAALLGDVACIVEAH